MTELSGRLDLTSAPVADWFTLADLNQDPYAVFARLRRETPVAWVPMLDRYFIARFEDCERVEKDNEVFEPDPEPRSKTKRAMGSTVVSKNEPEHGVDRAMINPTFRPQAVERVWEPAFRANANRYIDGLVEKGPGADLVQDFSVPYAAANLAVITGLPSVAPEDIHRWSRAFIAATGNHAEIPAIFEESDCCNAEVDSLVDEAIPWLKEHPDASMLSAMANSTLSREAIRANTKLVIAGGNNEPQHTLVSGVWAFDHTPEQRARLVTDPSRFGRAFEEVVRLMPPITVAARHVLQDVELSGVHIPADSYVLALFGSANRDEERFDRPDEFDIDRPRTTHLGFGAGVHICAGSWAARAAVGRVGWPLLYERLPRLQAVDHEATRWTGFMFRGIESMPVTWEE